MKRMTILLPLFAVLLMSCDEPEEHFEMNCEEGALFEYALSKYSVYRESFNGEFYPESEVEYHYDSTGTLVGASGDEWEGSVVIETFEREYIYDDEGRLQYYETVYSYPEYSSEPINVERNLVFYDGQDRLIEEQFLSGSYADGEYFHKYSTFWEYDEMGDLTQYLNLFTKEYLPFPCGYGYEWEFDDNGFVSTRHNLIMDSDTAEWELDGTSSDYIYDEMGRLSSVLYHYDSGDVSQDFVYLDDTGMILESHFSDDSPEHSYEWDGSQLTLITIQNGQKYRIVSSFTRAGDSSYWEIFPAPPMFWTVNVYGNGYINGCRGQ